MFTEQCGVLPMSLPTMRFRIPLGAEVLDKYRVSPLSILGNLLQMLHLTQLKMVRYPVSAV